jgi:hypothetical protein
MISTSTSLFSPHFTSSLPHPSLPSFPSYPWCLCPERERTRESERERRGREGEERMEEREEREVSAVSLSSFYCTCPDVSMSVPVPEFPAKKLTSLRPNPGPTMALSHFQIQSWEDRGPGLSEFSNSAKSRSPPLAIESESGNLCCATGWTVHCAFG